jgi:hypothetical protein
MPSKTTLAVQGHHFQLWTIQPRPANRRNQQVQYMLLRPRPRTTMDLPALFEPRHPRRGDEGAGFRNNLYLRRRRWG